jgi:hypothetical protein
MFRNRRNAGRRKPPQTVNDEFLKCGNYNLEAARRLAMASGSSGQTRRATAQVMIEILIAADATMQIAACSLFLLMDMAGSRKRRF